MPVIALIVSRCVKNLIVIADSNRLKYRVNLTFSVKLDIRQTSNLCYKSILIKNFFSSDNILVI